MHGRLKVKTTAEQKAEKEKERQKKLQLFKTGTQKIFEKRKLKEYDDEGLSISGQILQANPDFYTCWNIRREILTMLKDQRTEEEFQQLSKEELYLIENCLRKNPKSYGAWNQREWILLFMPHPDWERELQLCNRFLDLDERNFHCWDYRRFICKHSNVGPDEELKFTLKKVEANFSNYSAWHYRSSLLPIVHPSSDRNSVAEEILLKEYDLVQNAVFTDPSDQSAWFYHRWLLGRGEKPLKLNLLLVSRRIKRTTVQFTGPVQKLFIQNHIQMTVNDEVVEVLWKAPSHLKFSSPVWHCELSEELLKVQSELSVTVNLTDNDGHYLDTLCCYLNTGTTEAQCTTKTQWCDLFRTELSSVTTSVLEQELESCKQLNELEVDNKWVLLSCVLLMRALDSQKFESQTLEFIDHLQKIDSTRKNYYSDLRSRFIMENTVERLSEGDTEIVVVNQDLTTLYHLDHLVSMKVVDLSKNKISSLVPACQLLCIEQLYLDDNCIADCCGLEDLPCLTTLRLRNNCIKIFASLKPLEYCPNLQQLYLSGNPVCQENKFREEIEGILPCLGFLDY